MSTADQLREQMKKSQHQERRGAARRGTQLNAGSGNGWRRKNDARDATWLEEYKRTDRRSITFTGATLEELRSNALRTGRQPVLHFELLGRHWSIVLEEDFEGLNDDGSTSP